MQAYATVKRIVRNRKTITVAAFAAALLNPALPLTAQDGDVDGLYYYIIIERDTGLAISQGQMDIGGIDQIILPPETDYTIYGLKSATLDVAIADFSSAPNGLSFTIPPLIYSDVEDFDTDGDGLSDLREFIVGTNLFNPDTDDDGIEDGPEIVQGLNPLDGFQVETGIVGSGVVRGATTICMSNNLAILGQESIGVTVFNVTDSANPVRIADIPVPGTIMDVACSKRLARKASP